MRLHFYLLKTSCLSLTSPLISSLLSLLPQSLSDLFTIYFLRGSGHIGCFQLECNVLAVSVSLANITNININNTWTVINKLHKHPRRTPSLGLVLTDLLGDKAMMERTVVSCLTLSKFLWLCFWKRSDRVQAMCELTGNGQTWNWLESALGCMAKKTGILDCMHVRGLTGNGQSFPPHTNMSLCNNTGFILVYSMTYLRIYLFQSNVILKLKWSKTVGETHLDVLVSYSVNSKTT